jgi:hypothetical protein
MRVDLLPPEGEGLPHDAQIHVTIEDVSLLDQASLLVAEARVPVEESGEVHLQAALDPRRQYAVRVHVDRGGTGVVGIGDMVGSAPAVANDEHARVSLHLVAPAPDVPCAEEP